MPLGEGVRQVRQDYYVYMQFISCMHQQVTAFGLRLVTGLSLRSTAVSTKVCVCVNASFHERTC